MASTFVGLSIAASGLAASQTALAVTTNNISNVNTTGYSRQVVNQVSIGPAAIFSKSAVGAGVQVTSVDRVRSFCMDQKYWRQTSSLGEWETKASYLTEIESVLFNTEDDSFSTTMDDFYAALEDLAADPSSTSARAVLVEAGKAVCQYLNDAAARLSQVRSDINSDIKSAVGQINAYASQIASLNSQIAAAAATGASANELADARDALVDKLAELVGIEVAQTQTGTAADGSAIMAYTITVAGQTLVNGGKARQLACITASDGMYGIQWADTGEEFTIGATGTLKAYFYLRDGNDAANQGIPYYLAQLDEFARTLAKAFNEGVYRDGTRYYSGHAGGVGLDGSTGIRFFTYDGLSSADFVASGADTDSIYANITAANISLSADVISDTDKIAAGSADGEDGNNENVSDLISICQDTRMFASGSPEDFYNAIVAGLGTASAYAQRQSELQGNIVSYLNSSRSSVSGVSTNEETVNMTQYQAAYEASAKIISA